MATLVFEALLSHAVISDAVDMDYDRFAMRLNPNCDSQTKFVIADMRAQRWPVDSDDERQRSTIMKEYQETRVMGLLLKMLRSDSDFTDLRDLLPAVVAHTVVSTAG